MELATPLYLGGDRYLEAVSVGRDPDSTTVRDCPVCGGRSFDDEWHLIATVLDRSGARGDPGATRSSPGATGSRARFYYCSAGCLRDWLRLFPET
jgi:hypothetical protein